MNDSYELDTSLVELQSIMGMVVHKFKGPLQTILYNAKHHNNQQTHLEMVETMSGLLEIFSVVSTENDVLKTQFIQDIEPELSLKEVLTKSLNLALTQLLASGKIEYILQHYAQYLKTTQQVPTTTHLRELRKTYKKQIIALQQEWQQAFMNLAENNVELAQIQAWLTSHIAPLRVEGLEETIRFSQYGIKSSVFLIVFTELFLNAIKYSSSEPNHFIEFKMEKDDNFFKFIICNVGDDDTTVGSQKGHVFISLITRKLGGEFQVELLNNGVYRATIQLPLYLFNP